METHIVQIVILIALPSMSLRPTMIKKKSSMETMKHEKRSMTAQREKAFLAIKNHIVEREMLLKNQNNFKDS